MDQQFEDLVAYLRGRKPLTRSETPQVYADYLERVVRPLLAAAEEPRRRPRKEAEACA